MAANCPVCSVKTMSKHMLLMEMVSETDGLGVGGSVVGGLGVAGLDVGGPARRAGRRLSGDGRVWRWLRGPRRRSTHNNSRLARCCDNGHGQSSAGEQTNKGHTHEKSSAGSAGLDIGHVRCPASQLTQNARFPGFFKKAKNLCTV